MILRNFDIMELGCIEFRQSSFYVIPLLSRSLFYASVLSKAVSAFLIKYRLCSVKLDKMTVVNRLFTVRILAFSFILTWVAVLKLFCKKPAVVASSPLAIIHNKPLVKFSEIVLQLFLKHTLTHIISYLSIVNVCLPHFPSGF